MKKKAIEKIPYLTLPGVSRKKNVEYIGVTALVEVAGEEMLMLEIYRNAKDCRKAPKARVVVGQKDFGTFFPESGVWSRGYITKNTWSNTGMIWREGERRPNQGQGKAGKDILASEKDLERIRKFTEGLVFVHNKEEWWRYIGKYQKRITMEENNRRCKRRWERRQQALKDRGENTPELPEKKILDYADSHMFYRKHLLIYKKQGPRARVTCTGCGGVAEGRWKPGMSYESQFEVAIHEPREGTSGKCPMCGAPGAYKAQGKMKSFPRNTGYIFLGQKYKDTGAVFRYMEVKKEWQVELAEGEKGTEMYGACEKLSAIELARAYFEPGKKMQIDFHKHDHYTGKNFWDDCNTSGLASIRIHPGRVMEETYENIKGTFLRYSAVREYQEAAGVLQFNPVDYMERYIQTPQLEMLVKMKLTGVVEMLLKCHYGIVGDVDAKHPAKFLGIRKEQVKLLIKNRGDIKLLKVMQAEKRLRQQWTQEQVEALAETGIRRDQMAMAMQYMTVQKLLNRIKKYAGCEYGTGCSHATARLGQMAGIYIDYLGMRESLGYDLNNTVYQNPRSLAEAHAKMVQESEQEKREKRTQEAETSFPGIRKNYRKLRRKYYFEDEHFCIRPARSATEIIMEGRTLHHCVGGDTYMGRHNKGESIILFLRSVKEKELPYITVEMDNRSPRIQQWYGAHNRKPDEKNMNRWLDSYITRLKCSGPAAGLAADGKASEVTLPAMA